MKKTVSINLGDIAFQIDEDAYEALKKYIDNIRGKFSESEGRDEIIADIEARIAEMFGEKLTDRKQVVTIADVEAVIGVMGKPEDFDAVEEENQSGAKQKGVGRRLYRNPDDKVLGGVCSGVSAYLGISDPLWLRLAFVLAFFFGFGSSFLIYIILWLIVPKAQTTAEKLEMKGENVNISNIEKSIKDELSDLKKRLNDLDSKESKSKVRGFFQNLIAFFADLFGLVFKFISKIIGLVLLFAGLIIFLTVVFGLFIPVGISSFVFPDLTGVLFVNNLQMIFAGIAFLLLFGIPAIALVYAGLRVLFRKTARVKQLGAAMFSLWLMGLVTLIIIAGMTARDFRYKETARQAIPLEQPEGGTLYLGILEEGENVRSLPGFFIDREYVIVDDSKIKAGAVRLNIVKSQTDEFELVKVASARGSSRSKAAERAAKIISPYSQTDTLLLFHPSLEFDKQDNWRVQQVQWTLRVPEDKMIFIGGDMGDVIYNIENVTNTYYDDVVGRLWVMKKEGLACMDCDETKTFRQQTTGSQVSRSYNFKDFSRVKIGNAFKVIITQGDSYSVEIKGKKESLDNVEIDNFRGELSIGIESGFWKIWEWRNRDRMTIYITMPSLVKSELSGATEITIKGFKENEFVLDVSGASSVKADVEATVTKISISGASSVELSGSGDDMRATVTGASKFDAKKFTTSSATVDVTGASSAKINATKKLKASASGASDIFYKGSPKIDSDLSGFSSMKPGE